LIEQAGIATALANGDADPGIVMGHVAKVNNLVVTFITALARHRHPEREADALAK
jgi:catalase